MCGFLLNIYAKYIYTQRERERNNIILELHKRPRLHAEIEGQNIRVKLEMIYFFCVGDIHI